MPRISACGSGPSTSLAVEDVVIDDLEASEARAMSMPSDDGTESSAISRSGADVDVPPVGSLVLKVDPAETRAPLQSNF